MQDIRLHIHIEDTQPMELLDLTSSLVALNNQYVAYLKKHPETYLVNISGTTLDDHKVEVSRVYDELHPLMAIGRAVTEFYDSYVCGRIGSIIIKQRVVK